jgi:hypothetical protein
VNAGTATMPLFGLGPIEEWIDLDAPERARRYNDASVPPLLRAEYEELVHRRLRRRYGRGTA